MSRSARRRAERQAAAIGRVRAPERKWADLPRSKRARAYLTAWWRSHVGRRVCRIRGGCAWEFTTEYRTGRVMRDWQTCPRCWDVRRTPPGAPRQLTAR